MPAKRERELCIEIERDRERAWQKINSPAQQRTADYQVTTIWKLTKITEDLENHRPVRMKNSYPKSPGFPPATYPTAYSITA